jgi:hypothetical protein
MPPGVLTPTEIFYYQLDHPSNVLYSGIYVATTVVADSFLVGSKTPFFDNHKRSSRSGGYT